MKTSQARESAAALLRQERTEQRERKANESRHEHGQFGGYVFRPLRSRPSSVQLPSLRRPPRAAGPRPRPPANHAAQHHDEPLTHDRDPNANAWLLQDDKPRRVAEQDAGCGSGGDSAGGNDEHRRMLARAQANAMLQRSAWRSLPDPAPPAQAFRAALLGAALPGAAALFGSPPAAGSSGQRELLQAVISLVSAAARREPTDGPAPALAGTMMAAAQAFLQRCKSGEPLNLGQVKEALLSAQRQAPLKAGQGDKAQDAKVQNALLLLPLLVLNLSRPRTGDQHGLAVDRLQLMRQSQAFAAGWLRV
ncbi:hypothetical protein OOT46_23605 [Aquabacterium sp. A7-Y]|uniref:hypothetical protein n=1 Tax=Aquabacterium sp. A7-Y TaxID=1349605 RepID=UPI00223DBB4F|nr:hypothetical protein [Aquabacterium sp. A7-Y]MCW7540810.1 hypothetical protein [Aquabacterium sp. A7-Y]